MILVSLECHGWNHSSDEIQEKPIIFNQMRRAKDSSRAQNQNNPSYREVCESKRLLKREIANDVVELYS